MFEQTSLHLAALEGHLAVARYLIDRGADINTKTVRHVIVVDIYFLDVKIFVLSRM